MGSFTLAQVNSSVSAVPQVRPARQFTTTLVGTVVLNTEVVSDDIDRYPTDAIFTPAAYEIPLPMRVRPYTRPIS